MAYLLLDDFWGSLKNGLSHVKDGLKDIYEKNKDSIHSALSDGLSMLHPTLGQASKALLKRYGGDMSSESPYSVD